MPDGLLVRTARQHSYLEALISAAAIGGFVILVGSRFIATWEAAVLAGVSGVGAFLISKRTERFELRVNNQELVARGKVGDNLGLSRSVSTADILWLEHQQNTAAAKSAGHPDGLYAAVRHRSICLLPNLDAKQASSVIRRITERFPQFREQWAR